MVNDKLDFTVYCRIYRTRERMPLSKITFSFHIMKYLKILFYQYKHVNNNSHPLLRYADTSEVTLDVFHYFVKNRLNNIYCILFNINQNLPAL